MTVLKEENRPPALEDSNALRQTLSEQYQQVRRFSEDLCQNLEPEDYVVQSMPDVSPTKWHLAHVSWFFETFLSAFTISSRN